MIFNCTHLFNHITRSVWIKKYKILGLTLLELMIALTLSIFILGLIGKIYFSAQNHFLSQVALARIQETAHFISELFHFEIQQAGYLGCPKLTEKFPLLTYPPYELTVQNKIVSTAHSLITRHVSTQHNNLIQPMKSYSVIDALPVPAFIQGDILIISSCQSAEMLEVKTVLVSHGRQVITLTKPLHVLYQKNAELARFEVNTFYVNETDRKTNSGKPVFALYRSDRRGQKLELAEGVREVNIKQESEGVVLDFTLEAFPLSKHWHMYIGLMN